MDFWSAVERVGAPIVGTGLLGAGFWLTLVWLAKEIVKPIAKSHIEMVEESKKTNKINARVLKRVSKILDIKNAKLEALEATSEKILVLVEKNNQILTKDEA